MKIKRKLFGLVALDRAKCPKCRRMGFLNQYGFSRCCGYKVNLEGAEVSVERESEVQFNRRNKALTPTQKEQILLEQGYRCVYCSIDLNTVAIHFDHVVAFVYSGDNSERNMVAACGPCNLRKSSKVFDSLQEAKEWLSAFRNDEFRDRRS